MYALNEMRPKEKRIETNKRKSIIENEGIDTMLRTDTYDFVEERRKKIVQKFNLLFFSLVICLSPWLGTR